MQPYCFAKICNLISHLVRCEDIIELELRWEKVSGQSTLDFRGMLMLLGCLKRSICQWKAKNKKQIEGEILSNQELKKNIQIIIILLLNLNCDFY